MDPSVVNIKLMADIADLQSKMQQAKALMNDSMKGIADAVEIGKKALVAFAGVASIEAFAGMIKGNIEAAAAMGRLATQAGVTTEAMSRMASAGKISGTSAETIAGAMNKMTKAVAGTDEEAKGAGAAIAALGINFEDFSRLSADERMMAVAKAMDGFQDGTGKSAAAMAIMGKAGAEMLPYMRDLATVGYLQAKVTGEQAEQAHDFDLNLKRVTATSEAWKKELSMGMLPALDDASKAYLEVVNGVGGLREVISQLSKDGSIEEWTRNAISAMSYVADGAVTIVNTFRAVGDSMGWLAARLALLRMPANTKEELQAYYAARDAIDEESRRRQASYDALETLGEKLRASMEKVKQTKIQNMQEYQGAVQQVLSAYAGYDVKVQQAAMQSLKASYFGADKAALSDNFNRNAAAAGAIDKEVQAYNALIKSIGEKAGVTALELQSTEKLTAGQQEAAKFTSMLANGTLKLTDAHKATITVMLEEWIAQEKLQEARQKEEKATQAATEAHWKYLETLSQGLEKAQAEVTAMNEATARIGLSKEAVAALDAAKLDLMATELELQAIRAYDKNLDDAEYATLMKTAKAYRDLGKAKQVNAQTETTVSEFTRVWNSIDQTAHDTFVNVFQGGQDAFTKLRDTLKSTLLDLLYQMTVRKWVFNIVASVTGGSVAGAAQAATGGGVEGGLLGTIGGSFGSFGTGMGYGVQSLFANGLGGTLAAGGQMFGAGSYAAGLGTMAGAMLPLIGGAMALKNAMDYKIVHLGDSLTADFKSSGVTSVGTLSTDRQEGGFLGGGNTINGTWGVADSGTAGYIDASVKAATEASKAYAAAIGLDTTALDGFTKSVVINTSGMDAAATKAAIDAAVVQFQNDQIANAYGEALAGVARDGETTAQTMQRLATDLTAANQIMAVLGHTLFDVSTAGAAAASAFVQAMGGMAAAQSQMSAYYQGFYSKDEQRANVINDQIAALAAVGITSTYSDLAGADKETLRKAVEAFSKKKDTEEGAKQYAAVIKAANALLPTLDAVATAKPAIDASVSAAATTATNTAVSQVTSATDAIAQAMQAGASGIWDEVKRIHGLMDASGGAQGLADLQAQYAMTTASARSGSAEAAKALPGIVQALLPLLDATARTRADMQWQRGQIAASLADTGSILSSQFGLSIPQFAVGTNYVPRDMLAMVHEGESIIPKAYNPAAGGGQDYSDLLVEMQGMRTELADARRALGKIAGSNDQIALIALKSDTIGPAPARAAA